MPVSQAVKGSTIDAAWMYPRRWIGGLLDRQQEPPRLRVARRRPDGAREDPDAVREIGVLATYLDGVEVHSA